MMVLKGRTVALWLPGILMGMALTACLSGSPSRVPAGTQTKTDTDHALPAEIPGQIQVGDLVTFDFTLTLDDGTLYRTTSAPEAKKHWHDGTIADPDMAAAQDYVPEPVLVEAPKYKGDISGYLIGLKPGDKKRVILTPEEGGIPADDSKIRTYLRSQLKQEPEVGAFVDMGQDRGRIVSLDGDRVTLDFNPPVAGKNLVLDIDVLSLVKASRLSLTTIHWIEDYDEGLARLDASHKPMILFLERKGCPWCGRMETEVLTSPLIQSLGDDFVWVKIDSSQNKDIKTMFDQHIYPKTVLMNPDRNVYRSLDGFRDAAALWRDIRLWTDNVREGMYRYEPHTPDFAGSEHCQE